MATELAPAGGGPNRLFIAIAIGLALLLIIGVIGLGGFFLFQQTTRPAGAPTARVAAGTATRVLPSPTAPPTATELPPATQTSVISGTTPLPPTATGAATGTGTPGTGTLPQSGLGEDLLLLVGGVVLVLIVFAARRARTAGTN